MTAAGADKSPSAPESLIQLLDCLSGLETRLLAAELADVLWLAQRLPERQAPSRSGEAAEAPATEETESPRDSARSEAGSPDGTPAHTDADSGTNAEVGQERERPPGSVPPTDAGQPEDERIRLFPGRPNSPEQTGAGEMPSSSFQGTAARALPRTRQILRALRPLAGRVPSPRRDELEVDVEATLERITEGLLAARARSEASGAARRNRPIPRTPVLRPAEVRPYELHLVVDTSASMAVWEEAAGELAQLLVGLGSFSDVRVWYLDTQSGGEPPLYAGVRCGGGTQRGERRSGAELRGGGGSIPGAGARLVLVLTDGLGPAWWDGRALDLLASWADTGRVTLLQTLPERLWGRAVHGVPRWLVGAHEAGVPNRRLLTAPRPGVRSAAPANAPRYDRDPERVYVPVVALDPDPLHTWARLMTGRGGVWLPAFRMRLKSSPAQTVAPLEPVDPEEPETEAARAARMVREFRAGAPWEARRLAELFAAVGTLTIPVMRAIQDAMVAGSGLEALAEVLASGLLEAREAAGGTVYAFRGEQHGIALRQRLWQRASVPDTLRAMQTALNELQRSVGDFLAGMNAEGAAQPLQVLDPQGLQRLSADHALAPFAAVAAEYLESLGGQYVRSARTWQTGIALPPHQGDAGDPTSYSLNDLIALSRNLDGQGPWLQGKVPPIHLLTAAEKLGEPISAVMHRLGRFEARFELELPVLDDLELTALDEPLPNEADRIVLSHGLDGQTPWLHGRVGKEHLLAAAVQLREPVVTVRQRLERFAALFELELPAPGDPSPTQPLRVFVSASFRYCHQERRAILAELARRPEIVDTSWEALPADQRDRQHRLPVVAACDLFLLLPGEGPSAGLEAEYAAALEHGKTCLAYFHRDAAPLDETTREFWKRLRDRHGVRTYGSSEELIRQVSLDLDFELARLTGKVQEHPMEVVVLFSDGQCAALPVGVGVLDAAFHVDPELGLRMNGARVNGEAVPLSYQLRQRDQVELVTTPHSYPSREWLDWVQTERARHAIRDWLRRYQVYVAAGEIPDIPGLQFEWAVRSDIPERERAAVLRECGLFIATFRPPGFDYWEGIRDGDVSVVRGAVGQHLPEFALARRLGLRCLIYLYDDVDGRKPAGMLTAETLYRCANVSELREAMRGDFQAAVANQWPLEGIRDGREPLLRDLYQMLGLPPLRSDLETFELSRFAGERGWLVQDLNRPNLAMLVSAVRGLQKAPAAVWALPLPRTNVENELLNRLAGWLRQEPASSLRALQRFWGMCGRAAQQPTDGRAVAGYLLALVWLGQLVEGNFGRADPALVLSPLNPPNLRDFLVLVGGRQPAALDFRIAVDGVTVAHLPRLRLDTPESEVRRQALEVPEVVERIVNRNVRSVEVSFGTGVTISTEPASHPSLTGCRVLWCDPKQDRVNSREISWLQQHGAVIARVPPSHVQLALGSGLPYDALITSMGGVLPEEDSLGLHVVRIARRLRPELPVILFTHRTVPSVQEAREAGVALITPKVEVILRELQTLVDRRTPTLPEDSEGFYTERGLCDVIDRYQLRSGRQEADAVLTLLLLFRTETQRTWLATTHRHLYILLDDAETRATGPDTERVIQEELTLKEAQPVFSSEAREWLETRLLHIGRARNWHYTLSLHPRAQDLEVTVRELILNARHGDLNPTYRQLLLLAAEYEAIQATQEAGGERSRRSVSVYKRMQRSSQAADRALLSRLATSESPGERLAAVAILQEKPASEYLHWLAARVHEDQAFIGYQAALALTTAAEELNSVYLEEVGTSIRSARDTLTSEVKAGTDTDRYRVLERGLEVLVQRERQDEARQREADLSDLEQKLWSSDPEECLRIARILLETERAESGRSALVYLLAASDETIRLEAARLLLPGQHQPVALEALASLAGSEQETVRYYAAQLLLETKLAPLAVETLGSLLSSENTKNRLEAARLLLKTDLGAAAQDVLRRVFDSDDDSLRFEAARLLVETGHHNAALKTLRGLTTSDLASLRSEAAQLLERYRPVPAREGMRRALCVGIDDYPTAPLGGCVADARLWRETLARHRFTEIQTLFNGEATRGAILDRLRALIAVSRPGDTVVFQFAGRGTRVRAPHNDDVDVPAVDEALCAYDCDTGGLLTDEDLDEVFRAAPEGINITCFWDCSHSGTISRFASGIARVTAAESSRSLALTPQGQVAHHKVRLGRMEAPRAPGWRSPIIFSACRSDEVALESGGQGHFTLRATRVLWDGIRGLTNAGLHEAIIRSFGPAARQHPVLDCDPEVVNQPLFAPPTGRSAGDEHPSYGAVDSNVVQKTLLAVGTYDAFVSYSCHDTAWVTGELLPRLKLAGLDVWSFAERTTEPEFTDHVRQGAIAASRWHLVVVTPRLRESPGANAEITYRLEAGQQPALVPLLVEESELPPALAGLEFIDLRHPPEWGRQFEFLATRLRGEPGGVISEEILAAPHTEAGAVPESQEPLGEAFQRAEALAREYTETRRRMKVGADRTRAMSRIAQDMRALPPILQPLVFNWSRSSNAGERLLAIELLAQYPNAEFLDWLAARSAEEKHFPGYRGTLALARAAELLPPEHAAQLRETLAVARGNAERSGDPNQVSAVATAERVLAVRLNPSPDPRLETPEHQSQPQLPELTNDLPGYRSEATESVPDAIADSLVEDLAYELINEDPDVTSDIAESGAVAFGPDVWRISDAGFTNSEGTELSFQLKLYLEGEAEDRMVVSTTLFVQLDVSAVVVGDKWEVTNWFVLDHRLVTEGPIETFGEPVEGPYHSEE